MSERTVPSETILQIPEPGKREDKPVPSAEDAEEQPPLRLTEKAARMIKISRDQEGYDESYALRVAVRGGGCSGFEYALDFEREPRPNDQILEYHGLKVFVDPISWRYLSGVVIDYNLGVSGSGFRYENPRATGTCGCGSSFAVS